VSVVCCQKRSLRRSDHSSRGVLSTVVRRCVWSRNLENEEAKARYRAMKIHPKCVVTSRKQQERRYSYYSMSIVLTNEKGTVFIVSTKWITCFFISYLYVFQIVKLKLSSICPHNKDNSFEKTDLIYDPWICDNIWPYIKNNYHKHIFAITQLTTFGRLTWIFGSQTGNVFIIDCYKTDNKNVPACRELRLLTDASCSSEFCTQSL